jgi:hypothetical protein
MRGVSRLGRVVVLLLCVVVVAVLAGVSLADPFHLRQARWFTAGLIAIGLVLLTALLATGVPRGALRWVTLVVGVAALLGWAGLVYGASTLSAGGRQVAEADEAGRRLVTLERDDAQAYAVVVRSGGGPFEQESLVYQGSRAHPRPSRVSSTPRRSRSPSAPAITAPVWRRPPSPWNPCTGRWWRAAERRSAEERDQLVQ